MTQLIVNIEDKTLVPSIRKILSSIQGVTVKRQTVRKNGIDEAMEDLKEGRVNCYDSVDDLFDSLGI